MDIQRAAGSAAQGTRHSLQGPSGRRACPRTSSAHGELFLQMRTLFFQDSITIFQIAPHSRRAQAKDNTS